MMKKAKMDEEKIKETVEILTALIEDVKAGQVTSLLLLATTSVPEKSDDEYGLFQAGFIEDLGAFAHLEILAHGILRRDRRFFEEQAMEHLDAGEQGNPP